MANIPSSVLYVVVAFLAHFATGEINPKTLVHVYGEEHFLKECSFESATVKAVYPTLKAPIFQLLQNPMFVLVKTSDKANAVFLPEGLTKPITNPPVNPPIDVMLRSYDERYSLIFSLAHFPFKHFKELTVNDFLLNGKSLKNVPLTDIPVMAFYTKTELDELKTFFKFFYMGDLEITSNAVTPNRKSSDVPSPQPMQGYKSTEPMVGYPFANRLPANHPQKQSFFLAPVPVLMQEPHRDGPNNNNNNNVHVNKDNLNHNILNRSPNAAQNIPNKSAADLPVYSYKGVPLYIPKSLSHTNEGPMPYSIPSGISSTESPEGIYPSPSESPTTGPQTYSLPSGVGGSDGSDTQEPVSLVFPAPPKPYSLPSGSSGIDQ